MPGSLFYSKFNFFSKIQHIVKYSMIINANDIIKLIMENPILFFWINISLTILLNIEFAVKIPKNVNMDIKSLFLLTKNLVEIAVQNKKNGLKIITKTPINQVTTSTFNRRKKDIKDLNAEITSNP